MKKSVIILGVALVAFANVSMAAGHTSLAVNPKFEILNSSAGPLHVAISKGDVEIVRKFIAYGANVNEQSEDMTPLMIAARYNKVEIMKILLENGARPNDKNEKGYTALKYAEISNATDAIAILKSLK